MSALSIWRIQIDESQFKQNIDERVKSASFRITKSVKPLVYNIYQKATERHFTEETASAILDGEMQAEFISVIKVYGNFGHLFMGKLKHPKGELIQFDSNVKNTFDLNALNHLKPR